jgi:hypothetical protein
MFQTIYMMNIYLGFLLCDLPLEEVVLELHYKLHWQFIHISYLAPHVIVLFLKYTNDLIISLAAVLN